MLKPTDSLNQSDVAALLLDCGCLKLSAHDPFTYASGLKGPIYCDNRLVLSYPKARAKLVSSLVSICRSKGLDELTLAGVASAGVPHAAFMAQELERPMIYVRSEKKSHGRQNRVEGLFRKGDHVLVVEDLVNQGGSICEAIQALRMAGLVVEHAICLVSYQIEKAKERMQQLGVELHYLCDFDAIIEQGVKRGQIEEGQLDSLKMWQKDPKSWSENK